MVQRVVATDATLALIDELKGQYGDFFFHQSGGCCDNSAANAYLPGELTIGAGDVYLGDIGVCRSTSAPTSSNTGNTPSSSST